MESRTTLKSTRGQLFKVYSEGKPNTMFGIETSLIQYDTPNKVFRISVRSAATHCPDFNGLYKHEGDEMFVEEAAQWVAEHGQGVTADQFKNWAARMEAADEVWAQ